jgi:hypothetical protein
VIRIVLVVVLVLEVAAPAATYTAYPTNYLDLLSAMVAGDTLILTPGDYNDLTDVPGLPFFGKHGTATDPIVIMGQEGQPKPRLLGRNTHNTVRFDDASYIILRSLEIDGQDQGADAVKAQGIAHHITLEDLYIHGVGDDQQTVGISTKDECWNWIIRNCVISNAGTGIYLGNSDGTAPFIAGLIENNLIVDTIGYNMQVKHQVPRVNVAGMPTNQNVTIIRDNVFSKANNGATGGNARPNLLVGHWPTNGPGTNDRYFVSGNFFYRNPTGEPLFQGEGHIALYNNIFVNPVGSAVAIQAQNNLPKDIDVFFNTVLSLSGGISISGVDTAYEQRVSANAVFSPSPLSGGIQTNNITGSSLSATNHLVNPFGAIGALDVHPLPGALTGSVIDTSSFTNFHAWNDDYDQTRRDGMSRGAYISDSSTGSLALARKFFACGPISAFASQLGTAVVSFATQTGRTYSIHSSPALVSPTWTVVTNIAGSGADAAIPVSPGTQSTRVYRVLSSPGFFL